MSDKPGRIRKSKRKLGKRKEPTEPVTLESLGLPTWGDIVRLFFMTHSMEAGKAIAHWVHTPDCCPRARDLIRDALKLDGTTADNKDAQYLFKCPTCCDSERIAGGGQFVDCPKCKPTKPTKPNE